MAWNAPITWTIGQLVDASDLNEQIRDNLLHLKILVNDDGKIPALSTTYVANLSGADLTGVAKTASDNDFTDGVHDFGGGSGARLVLPVGADKWAVA
jgi:hypothetical protein